MLAYFTFHFAHCWGRAWNVLTLVNWCRHLPVMRKLQIFMCYKLLLQFCVSTHIHVCVCVCNQINRKMHFRLQLITNGSEFHKNEGSNYVHTYIVLQNYSIYTYIFIYTLMYMYINNPSSYRKCTDHSLRVNHTLWVDRKLLNIWCCCYFTLVNHKQSHRQPVRAAFKYE